MTEVQIETERLLLRRWKSDDVAPYANICADPDVMRWIGSGTTQTQEQAAAAIDWFEKEWLRDGYGLFAVVSKLTGQFVGFTGLSKPDFLPEVLPSVEVGWRFAKQCWGRGYATEAAKSALAFGQNDLGLKEIVSICQVGNDSSERIMKKLGMQFDRETLDPICGRRVRVYRVR